ncbi:MAG: nucleotidyltransferase family protein, partial [Bdellovibrionales bacterium]|nr:nucleotidyltransferase family protein [Bdellovibrionales bacterium]
MIEAMLLAAGFSTRLHPLTCDIPKPMLPFLNRKLLDFTVGYLSHFGIKRLSTNAHHGRTPFIKELSMHHALNIHPFIEDSILGTGGGIQNMRSFLTQDDFMVINCDFVCDINLKEAYAKHKSSGAIATLVLVEHEDQQKYGEIGLDDRGQIVQFPKQNLSTTTPIEKGMFSGIHFLNRKIFDLFPNKSSFCIVRDVYQPALEKGITFNGYLSKARWLDVGEVQKYATAQFQLLETPFKWMTTLFEDSIIEAGKAPSNRFAVGNF